MNTERQRDLEGRLATAFRYTGSSVRIHAGADALQQLPREVERLGCRRALLVCGRSVAASGLLARARELLGGACAGAFERVAAESPLPLVEEAAAAARDLCADLIVGIGGGSAVVTARAATIMLAEEGDAHALCTQYPPDSAPVSPRLLRPKLPNILVLTTPTTAADRAGAAVLDPVQHRRLELFDPKTRPRAIIVDPSALLTAPPRLFLRTAATTFGGVAGALQSPRLNAFAFADLREALDLLRCFMPRLLTTPEDQETRLQLAVAALLGNRAADAGTGGGGVVTALVHQLQARFAGIGQGSATAVLLAPGMRFNATALVVGQRRLAGLLGLLRAEMSDEEAGAAAAEWIASFLAALGLPVRLRELGAGEDDLPAVAEAAMHDFFLRGNPRPVREAAELLAVLHEAW